MNNKTRLLLLAALVLALPLIFMGNANAGYNPDGATYDATSHGWKIPPITAGTGCLADPTKTSRPDCNTITFPAYATGAACSASAEFAAGQAEFASVCLAAGSVVNLKDHDRNALQCNKLGGTSYAKACVGKWTDVLDTAGGSTYQCLRCHNNTYQRNGTAARWKTSYLKTGHKNMLRKVTAGEPWAGPDGADYHANAAGSGTMIDWATATVTSTAFTGSRQLYYIYGDWMAPAPSLVYDSTVAGTANYAKYSCASCHTTGYIATNFVVGKEPNNTYPGLTSGITGSWDVNGIVCSRCHNAVSEGTSYTDPWRVSLQVGTPQAFTSHESPNLGDGAAQTGICFECHNSTQTKTDPAGQLKQSATGAGFSGHIIGNMFLNSPHAKFTGTSSQIGSSTANYASHFGGGTCTIIKTGVTAGTTVEAMTSAECAALVTEYNATSYTWTATTPGSCSVCHDVHQSMVPEVGAAEPLRRECGIQCHANKPIRHPSGVGTPIVDINQPAAACGICHMPKDEKGTHVVMHLFRINPDVAYSTYSAGTIANTAADGTYTNAVWVDLDDACGQCHGGGTDQASSRYPALSGGAPYLTKAQLADYAPSIHGSVTASFFWAPDALVSNKVNFNGTGSVCQTGYTCTYSWDFGDGSPADTTATPSHTYAGAGPYTVSLTYKSGYTFSNTATQTVTPTAVNAPPVAARGAVTISNMTVSFTDASTDDGTVPACNDYYGKSCASFTQQVTVSWGDGVVESKPYLSAFSHTYVTPGTYILRQIAQDVAGLQSRVKDASGNDLKVTVPTSSTKYTISGTILDDGSLAVAGATVSLKKGTVTLKATTTDASGNYSFTGLATGTYNVVASKYATKVVGTAPAVKYGLDWNSGATGIQSLSAPVSVAVSADTTQNFSPVWTVMP